MFCQRLSETRKLRGFTAQQMASQLYLSIRTYRYYESGGLEPSLKILTKIADILEVPVDYLLGRDEYVEKYINK